MSYYIFRFSGDGPERVEGNKCYSVFYEAEKEVKRFCRGNPQSRYGIFEDKGQFWLDPEPKVLNNLPIAVEEDFRGI